MCKQTQSALVCTAYKAALVFRLSRVSGSSDTSKIAVAFENGDVVLSEEQAEHINERQERLDLHPRAWKFKQNFHVVSCLARLTKMTWRDSNTYQLIEKGYKEGGHGHYFMHVFMLPKVIGTDPWGFPSRKICVYFSWRPLTDERFHIITHISCNLFK